MLKRIFTALAAVGLTVGFSAPALAASPSHELIVAAYDGRVEQLHHWLARGADINARDENGFTPLHWAVHRNHLPLMRYLIAQGADVEARDRDHATPLVLAAAQGHVVAFKTLLDAGADIEATTRAGFTAVEYAREKPHEQQIQAMVDAAYRAPRHFNHASSLQAVVVQAVAAAPWFWRW